MGIRQREARKSEDIVVRRFVYAFGALISLISIIYCFFVTFFPIPEANRDLANIVLGFLLSTALSTILNFFFGTSKGSVEQREAMAKLLAEAMAKGGKT